jgi:hypothetical protein
MNDRREYCEENEEYAMVGVIVRFVIDELIQRRLGRKKDDRGPVQDGDPDGVDPIKPATRARLQHLADAGQDPRHSQGE